MSPQARRRTTAGKSFTLPAAIRPIRRSSTPARTRAWTSTSWAIQLGDNATADNAFNHDIYNGNIRNTNRALPADGTSSFEQNGAHFTESQLIYKPGNGWSSVPTLGGGGSGSYQLENGSVGLDAGKVLPNFNDGYSGSFPDAGAHEQGAPAMTFGIGAN